MDPIEKKPIIELKGVRKRFGDLLVLRGVDLALYEGECTVIIGESGSGKSVTLKHIIGLLKPDAGEVYYQGRRTDTLTERQWVALRKDFGFLFQMGALFDSMTAGENVAFPLHEHTRLSQREIDEVVREKLRMVGLEGIESKKPGDLSGGQRKRVALARAVALNAKVILYDEPTTGLDPVRGDIINELIIKLQRELRVTSIVVTHDMNSAYKVGDRIVMLYDGEFIADGTPDEIRSWSDQRVQRFIAGKASEEELMALRNE
jgi:phospholipid/cholesterol/gamma-HCH transport system ATP-binding protein